MKGNKIATGFSNFKKPLRLSFIPVTSYFNIFLVHVGWKLTCSEWWLKFSDQNLPIQQCSAKYHEIQNKIKGARNLVEIFITLLNQISHNPLLQL